MRSDFHLSDESENEYRSDGLQDHYQRYPDVKLLVLSLVLPHLKAEPRSDTSADESKE